MIVSHLMGGAGNQLFQVAASIGAAEKHINEWKVSDNFIWKDYVNIPDEKYIGEYSLPRYDEPFFHYEPLPKVNDVELFGYFQSYKYFNHCRHKIRQYFSPRFEVQPVNDDAVAVHIRGGDYLNLSEYHYNLQTDYYKAALEHINAKKIFVFTDDNAHAERVMPHKDFYYFEGGSDAHDFFQMTKFKHIIIANSSFSWWAAYLSDADVVAPANWFGEKKNYRTDDLYMPNWRVI